MAQVAVALSGGVDSSVAAWLALQAGHTVVGVTLRVWPTSHCCDERSLADARAVALRLGLPHRIYDVEELFDREVVTPFCAAYLAGQTPSPCPGCNRLLKFGALPELVAAEYGPVVVASGHYARVRLDERTGRYQLCRGLDPRKDQSYMLYGLSQEQLARAWFPVGDYCKEDVRRLAVAAGLPTADKPESQDACFVEGDVHRFLEQRCGDRIRPGAIVDRTGRVLGEHPGLAHYTLGQRKGLGRSHAEPLYVIELRPATNEVVVGSLADTLATELHCPQFSWTSLVAQAGPLQGQVKIRYGSPPAAAWLEPAGPGCRIRFAQPLPSVTPGQVAVFYQQEVVVGGGIIGRSAGG